MFDSTITDKCPKCGAEMSAGHVHVCLIKKNSIFDPHNSDLDQEEMAMILEHRAAKKKATLIEWLTDSILLATANNNWHHANGVSPFPEQEWVESAMKSIRHYAAGLAKRKVEQNA